MTDAIRYEKGQDQIVVLTMIAVVWAVILL